MGKTKTCNLCFLFLLQLLVFRAVGEMVVFNEQEEGREDMVMNFKEVDLLMNVAVEEPPAQTDQDHNNDIPADPRTEEDSQRFPTASSSENGLGATSESDDQRVRDELDALMTDDVFASDNNNNNNELYRYKRGAVDALVAGSGQELMSGFITLSTRDLTAAEAIPNSQQNIDFRVAAANAMLAYFLGLRSDGGFLFEVNSLSSGSIISGSTVINFQMVFSDALTIQEVAALFVFLGLSPGLPISGVVYPVRFPTFIDPGTSQPVYSVCYTCSQYQACVTDPTTLDPFCQTSDPRYFPFGSSQQDSSLPKGVSQAFTEIIIDTQLPYGVDLVDRIYISVDGIISFGSLYASGNPTQLPIYTIPNNPFSPVVKLLCPYWTDLELIPEDTTANVFYHLYVRDSSNTAAEAEIFTKANTLVSTYDQQLSSYESSHVIVVTWEQVPPYRAAFSQAEKVNFQVVIITDGQSTYVSYVYAPNGMNFNPILGRAVVVGYERNNFADLTSYYNFDTIVGNTNSAGYWVFKIGAQTNNRALCWRWYRDNLPLKTRIQELNNVFPRCPCNPFVAARSGFWLVLPFEPNCLESNPFFGNIGRKCCYSSIFGFIFYENRIPLAGSLHLGTYYFNPTLNDVLDRNPKQWCCNSNNLDLCPLYYELRPTRECGNGNRLIRALLFGDPHVVTLDAREFMFNGVGEYTMVHVEGLRPVDNATIDFTVQARTCQAMSLEGVPTDATNYCAIAGRDTNGTSFQVSIDSSGNYMEIYVNKQDFSALFLANPEFQTMVQGVSLLRKNDSVKIFTPDNYGLTVSLSDGLLNYDIELSPDYQGMTKGLLGNFNGDKTDDFVFPNGTTLPDSASDREIFHYGQTWHIDPAKSLFKYPDGKSAASYTNASFIPLFLDEVDPARREEAETTCGGADKLACIFDLIATGNEELAKKTSSELQTFEEEEADAANEAPVINTPVRLNTTVGETSTFTIVATDPDNDSITYRVIEKPSGNQFTDQTSDGQFTGTITLNSTEPVLLSIAAADSSGLQSEIQVIHIVNCNGCGDNGRCDFDKTQSVKDAYYTVAACVCDTGYTGDSCEKDKDGCEFSPCPTGTDCTDAPATQEAIDGLQFSCSGCPDGLRLTDNNTKCEDINECDQGVCDENALCKNTIGSYICTCNPGFRKAVGEEHTCVDINECIENSHQCAQICNNTMGTYDCSCELGFDPSGLMGRNCTKSTTDPCGGSDCEYGCRLDGLSKQCFCAQGYKLKADGTSCEDVNECDEKLCSQNCDNNDGSYICSCYPGFTLDADRHTCIKCTESRYGVDCAKRCECRGRATKCDNVQGCVCIPEWTGEFCTEDVNECLIPDKCPEGQICTNINGSFTCTCPVGYEARYNNGTCYDIDECKSGSVHNCPQGCRNNPGSFTCLCNPGYNYNIETNTCDDINECALGYSGCTHRCLDLVGSYNCECFNGFVLRADRKSCLKAEDVCADSGLSCEFDCTLVNESPKCICPIGFRVGTDDSSCIDIDECESSSSNGCSDTCKNMNGTYECSCPAGKKLDNDKRTCVECDEYHWGDGCANECSCNPIGQVTCNKVTGCVCKEGWTGTTCFDDVNECNAIEEKCTGGSKCTNAPGSYICSCSDGYQKDGNNVCININECDSNPCDQTCVDTTGSYTCSCSTGFRSEGDRCVDIDECQLQEVHQCSQQCRNTFGSFYCECLEGFLLNTTTLLRNTCYRDQNAATCQSDPCNSNGDCIRQGGQDVCVCRSGYRLDLDNVTCSNIDECTESTPCVGEGALCTDTDGSFTCECTTPGFKLGEDRFTCVACQSDKYGDDCAQTCNCDFTRTQLCNSSTGECVCNSGWNGNDCSSDIDECETVDCGSNSNCKNDQGSYTCTCETGFVNVQSGCEACSLNWFGVECRSQCTCVLENTDVCNNVDGACTCKAGWEGENCSEDIDECETTANYCPDAKETCTNLPGSVECRCISGYTKINGTCEDNNECIDGTSDCVSPKVCNNTVGSFDCVCAEGYALSGNTCVEAFKAYLVNFTFSFSAAYESSLPNDFVMDAEPAVSLKAHMEAALLDIGRNGIGQAILSIIVKNFRKGSLIADAEIKINNQYTNNANTDLARYLDEVIQKEEIVIGSESATPKRAQLETDIFEKGDDVACAVYNQLESCKSGTECSKVDGVPQCLPVEDDSDKLKIGLGVGIPLFVILCVVICVAVYLCIRDKKYSRNSTPSVDRHGPFQSVFATQMPKKGTFGSHQRFGLYSPDNFSDAGTSESSNDGRPLRTRQKVHTGFHDSPWYDNQAMAARAVPMREAPTNGTSSHEGVTDAGGPTSNFSWEYMFRLLEPHRGFEIQRPNLSASPNPTFTPRPDGRHPDSKA